MVKATKESTPNTRSEMRKRTHPLIDTIYYKTILKILTFFALLLNENCTKLIKILKIIKGKHSAYRMSGTKKYTNPVSY